MTDLVFAHNGQAITTSKIIASGTENTHHAVMQLLRNYKADFETFGVLAFEMPKPSSPQGGRPETIALLNEQQATLLVTYCKNTEVVRKFKVALVKAFYDMRQQLMLSTAEKSSEVATLTPAQQLAIQQAVGRRAQKTANHYQTIYRAIKLRYQIARYDQLPQSQFEDCLAFIETVNLKAPETAAAAPQQPPLPAQPKPQPSMIQEEVITKQDCERLLGLVYDIKYLHRQEIEAIQKMLEAVHSPLAPAFYELSHSWALGNLERNLAKHGYRVEKLACYQYFIGQAR